MALRAHGRGILRALPTASFPLRRKSNVEGHSFPRHERIRRLELLCDAYGLVRPGSVLEVVGPRLDELAAFTRTRPGLGHHVERCEHAAEYVRRFADL